MKKRHIALGIAALTVAGVGTAAYVLSPEVHSGQTGEAPELGRLGEYAVGTTERDFTLPARTSITGMSALTGNLETADRTLPVRFWYPAINSDATEAASYSHDMTLPGQEPFAVVSKGIAVSAAAALPEEKFPLVLMSHGYGGWNTQFSNLAEHIASQGYVVASIDHQDQPADGIASFAISFGNVLVDRTLDQRQVLNQILADTAGDTATNVDRDRVALIGYSMGGYGAIATAGAAYDFSNDPLANVPDAAQETLRQASSKAAPIQALITFAPWGGQPDSRAWSAQSLAQVKVPTLLVAGNQDDVVNFKDGVSWLYENLTGTDRHMLVYREARHNIIGNRFELAPDTPFAALEFLKEPVWRTERLNAINQHFVTAFLDLHLKGDSDKTAYLAVPTVDSNTSEWPVSFGEQLNGEFAGPDQDKHWRGFQRRWAVGLEMYHAKVGN